MTLTFRHDIDDLFTYAFDEKGRGYRVLLTCGNGAHYHLAPWDGTKAATHRGRYIKEADPLFPAIDAAEAVRREREQARPIDPKRFARFAAESI